MAVGFWESNFIKAFDIEKLPLPTRPLKEWIVIKEKIECKLKEFMNELYSLKNSREVKCGFADPELNRHLRVLEILSNICVRVTSRINAEVMIMQRQSQSCQVDSVSMFRSRLGDSGIAFHTFSQSGSNLHGLIHTALCAWSRS